MNRIAALLRCLGSATAQGVSTSSAARTAGISRPTGHRLLSALASQGLVDRIHASGHWVLGPEMFLLGAVAAERYDITETARKHVVALAEETGESAFLSARRGSETVCLLRHDGSFPIRSFVLYEGKRFPLGVASAGLAILSFLPPETIERSVAGIQDDYGDEHSPARLRDRITETRTLGYAVNPGLIVPGSWGMGAAVFDAAGQPAWALSLTGVESRFAPERRPALGRLLLEHAHRLTQQLARDPR